jgi:hypothetical protein
MLWGKRAIRPSEEAVTVSSFTRLCLYRLATESLVGTPAGVEPAIGACKASSGGRITRARDRNRTCVAGLEARSLSHSATRAFGIDRSFVEVIVDLAGVEPALTCLQGRCLPTWLQARALGRRESNSGQRLQRPPSFHWTTPHQFSCRRSGSNRLRPA